MTAIKKTKGDMTRDHLRSCALALLCVHGYAAMTIRMVADKAGLAEGALYRHYPSKEAMIRELFSEETARVTLAIRDLKAQAADETAFLSSLVVYLCRLYDEKPLTFRLVFLPDPGLKEKVHLDDTRPFQEVSVSLEALLKGRERELTPHAARMLAAQALGLILYTAQMMDKKHFDGPMMDMSHELIESLMRMVVRRFMGG
ncbi:MAG: TetR/AcrR family transcriptional regulator [Alphaproteobacteria bacterium]